MHAMAKARRGRHEGSIRQRDAPRDGLLSYDGDGKRIQRSVYGDSKQEVIAAMNELRALPRPTMATSSKANGRRVRAYVEAAMVAEARLRENTLAYYQSHMRTHVLPSSFASMAIGQLTLRTSRGCSPVSLPSGLERAPTRLLRRCSALLPVEAWFVRTRLSLSPSQRPTARPRRFGSPRRRVACSRLLRRRAFTASTRWGLVPGFDAARFFALRARDIDLDRRTVRIERQLLEVEGKLSFADPRTERSARTVQLPGFVVEALRTRISALSLRILEFVIWGLGRRPDAPRQFSIVVCIVTWSYAPRLRTGGSMR